MLRRKCRQWRRDSRPVVLDPDSFRISLWRIPLGILSALLIISGPLASHRVMADEAVSLEPRPLTDYFGMGARASGMGGAAIAVCEDLSSLYWNPAGLARVRRIEISGGLSHQRYTSETTYSGIDSKDRESNTRLNSIGIVFPVPTYRGSLVFALGTGRVRNFDAFFVQSGYSEADGGWLEGQETQSGGLFSWSLGGAIDVSPTLSLGAAVNLWDGDYQYDWEASLSDIRNLREDDISTLHESVSEDFDGLNVKLGGLLRLSRFVKAGMTITSPVTYDIAGEAVERYSWVFDDGSMPPDEIRGYYVEDEISTPWEFGFGLAASIPTVLIAADLRYVDWSQMKSKYAPRDDYENYEEALSLSLGGEYVLPAQGVKLRAGFASEPLAFRAAKIIEDRRYFTLGAGFLVGQVMTLDLAWVKGSWKTHQGSLSQKDDVTRMYLTAAYRF